MTDNRKASITAKVAAQCVEFYKAALRFLESSNPTRQFGSSQVKVSGIKYCMRLYKLVLNSARYAVYLSSLSLCTL